jgi:hypothetical protein
MIPKVDCKHGYVYRINSRNLIAGVYNSQTGGFVGIREKFGSEYLFPEFHRDNGPPYGTVSPVREIEKCPVEDIRDHLDTVCRNCDQRCEWKMTDPEKKTGVWYHLAEGTRKDAKPCDPHNDALFKYMKGIERRINLEILKEECQKAEDGWRVRWTVLRAIDAGLVTEDAVIEKFGEGTKGWLVQSNQKPDSQTSKAVYGFLLELLEHKKAEA